MKYTGTHEKEKIPKRQLQTSLAIQVEEINKKYWWKEDSKDTEIGSNNTNKTGHSKIMEKILPTGLWRVY